MLHAWVWTLAASSLGYDTINLARQGPNPDGPDKVVVHITDEDLPPDVETVPGALTLARTISIGHLLGSDPVLTTDRSGSGSHILLSSGTTGRTKGIAFSDEILKASLTENASVFEYDQDALIYLWQFQIFTAAGYRIPLQAWHLGATVVFEQDQAFGSAFSSGELTDAILTPGLLADLLASDSICRHEGLRLLIVGGAVDWVLVEQCRERLTKNVWAAYGSTEAGALCMTPLANPVDTRIYSIVPGRKVRILTEGGEELAPGGVGLVWVEPSEGLIGYRSDETLTRAWFRDGWFCTGDLGSLTQDGRLELLGRANDVIIVRGDKRPSLPYEQRVLESTGLTSCLFVVQGDTGAGKARLVVERSEPLDEASIQAIQASLVDLRMPVEIRLVAAMPRNHMGKIVRRELL